VSFELPSEPELQVKVLEFDAQHRSKKLDQGWIGWLFGSSSEKNGNIAGMSLIVLLLTFVCIIFFYPSNTDLTKKDAVTIVAGIITTILGFIFGRASA
jgi:hypothetical protein